MNHITSAVFIGAAVPTAAGGAEPVTGSGGRAWSKGRDPAGSRGKGAKPPGAERLLAFGHPMEAPNLP